MVEFLLPMARGFPVKAPEALPLGGLSSLQATSFIGMEEALTAFRCLVASLEATVARPSL